MESGTSQSNREALLLGVTAHTKSMSHPPGRFRAARALAPRPSSPLGSINAVVSVNSYQHICSSAYMLSLYTQGCHRILYLCRLILYLCQPISYFGQLAYLLVNLLFPYSWCSRRGLRWGTRWSQDPSSRRRGIALRAPGASSSTPQTTCPPPRAACKVLPSFEVASE